MFLALKEMARAKTRFGLLVAAIALLVFLILFQQSLQNGLITGFVGAIRNQNAPVLVYSVDGQRVVQGSTAAMRSPSRRCRCQSSGRVIVRVALPLVLPLVIARSAPECSGSTAARARFSRRC